MNKKIHEIVIENLKPEETLTYSIVIIRGYIRNTINEADNLDKLQLLLLNFNGTISEVELKENKFKTLIELKLGENEIELNYCCESSAIKLRYIPRSTRFTVVPVYVICEGHDGEFQAPRGVDNTIESALRRITLSTKLLQSVFAEKLYEQNLGRKTFQLEQECVVFRSKLNCETAREMEQEELWATLGREIMGSHLASANRKYLGFLSCTRYRGGAVSEALMEHEEMVRRTDGYVALGGGGLALFGTACLYTWPKTIQEVVCRFLDRSPIDSINFMDDSCYRGTYGTCFSTTLGSVLHELCHTFDLGHTETGIMGRGFDNIYKVFIADVGQKTVDISKAYQSQIEFKETLDSGRLSERLANKRKEYCVKRAIDPADDTFWTRSCSVFLSYHKFFNSHKNAEASFILKYDPATKFVTSTAGLRVIEGRSQDNEMVMKYWIFDGRILKYSFQIPEEIIKEIDNSSAIMLVVEDNAGNILKEMIS